VKGIFQTSRHIRVADHHQTFAIARGQNDFFFIRRIQLVERRHDVTQIHDGPARSVGLMKDYNVNDKDDHEGAPT
jgi:hypothetical protein